jgi:hypothetical protein
MESNNGEAEGETRQSVDGKVMIAADFCPP